MRELMIEARAHVSRFMGPKTAIFGRGARLSIFLIGIGGLVAMTSGCAQVMAIRQPAPLDRNLLAVGTDRTTVIGVFGAPVSSDDRLDGGRTEVYKYTDGGTKNAWWSKTGRVVVYTAGDVFTAWLDQVIWMPLELAFRGTEYASTVDFDRNGERLTVRNFEEIDAKTGKAVRSAGTSTPVASR